MNKLQFVLDSSTKEMFDDPNVSKEYKHIVYIAYKIGYFNALNYNIDHFIENLCDDLDDKTYRSIKDQYFDDLSDFIHETCKKYDDNYQLSEKDIKQND